MQTKWALEDEVYSSRRARETPMALSAADIHVPRTCLIIPAALIFDRREPNLWSRLR